MWLRQFNDIINLFLVKQECSSGASFEKSRSIEPYANSSPNRFFPIDFLNTAFNEILFSATRTIHSFNSRSLLPFPLRSFLSQFILDISNKVENLRQIQRKKLFCDTVFSVISICATNWNYGEAVVKYFLLSLSFIPLTDRVLGPYYKLRTDFYHADVWPRAKCVGHTRSVHNYQRSLSRNKPNAVFFLISGNLLSIPD